MAAAAEIAYLVPYMASQEAIGADYRFFMEHHQTTGWTRASSTCRTSWPVRTRCRRWWTSCTRPIALYLFVPFLVLPAVLWWAIPMTVFAASIAWLRPARWTWPLIALGVAWPQTLAQLLYGNTNMWVAAMIAAGVVLAWPSVMILFKPAFAPFALIGIKRRRWWVAMGVLCLAALPFGAMWLDYATVIRKLVAERVVRAHQPAVDGGTPDRLGRVAADPTECAPRGGSLAQAVPHVDDLATGEIE